MNCASSLCLTIAAISVTCVIIHTVKDQSFGVIPVQFQQGEVRFLLIQHHAGHWAFPKGHAERGESDAQTALRELREETGISDVRLLDGVALTECYYFKRDMQTVTKMVRYFIGVVASGDVRIQASEIRAYKWANYANALSLITFAESRRIISEAHTYLTAHTMELIKEIGD